MFMFIIYGGVGFVGRSEALAEDEGREGEHLLLVVVLGVVFYFNAAILVQW